MKESRMLSENPKLKKTSKSEQQAKAKYGTWCEKFFGHVRPAYISNNISVPAFNKPSDIKYLDPADIACDTITKHNKTLKQIVTSERAQKSTHARSSGQCICARRGSISRASFDL